jgi:hypothetical protein
MLRISHCLDSRLTDGGEVVSLTHRPLSTPQRQYFSASGTHLCRKLRGLVRLEGLGKLKKLIYFIGSRTRDLPACSIVPQPLHYRSICAPPSLSETCSHPYRSTGTLLLCVANVSSYTTCFGLHGHLQVYKLALQRICYCRGSPSPCCNHGHVQF